VAAKEPYADEHVDKRVPARSVPEDGEDEDGDAGTHHEQQDASDGDLLDDR
jgi:hypothetical protein